MQKDINSKKPEASKASPYLVFRLVTTNDLLNIEHARESGKIGRGVRMTHYVDWNILILKVPTAQHEAAHGNFSDIWVSMAAEMGLRGQYFRLGATKFSTRHISKEGDSAYKPLSM
jgi:hypothetical protein